MTRRRAELLTLAVAMAATAAATATISSSGSSGSSGTSGSAAAAFSRAQPAVVAVNVVNVVPGQLHRCAAAARAAETDAQAAEAGAAIPTTRCILAPGLYRETVEYSGPAPLEIVGSGQNETVLRGDAPLANLSWTLLPPKHNDSEYGPSSIYRATLPADTVLRTPGVKQAFIDDTWLPEARYPNTNLDKILRRTSWADCGKGSAHGYCKDRPDAWSDLGAEHVNWTGATATLLLGAQYAVWTKPVKAHGRGWFQYSGALGPGPGTAGAAKPGGRYFLSGVLGALDSPGEWFIDESNWTVYVWAPDSQPPADRVSVRVRDFCVDASHSRVVLKVGKTTRSSPPKPRSNHGSCAKLRF